MDKRRATGSPAPECMMLELDYLRPLFRECEPGSKIAMDVGAHRGEVARPLLAEGFSVLAIEANTRLCEELTRSLAHFVAGNRLKVLNAAASDCKGFGTLLVGATDTVSTLEKGWTT